MIGQNDLIHKISENKEYYIMMENNYTDNTVYSLFNWSSFIIKTLVSK